MQIIERPYNISYSLNDIRYVFQLDNLERTGLQLQVKLLYKPLGGTFEELYTFLLQPATDGTIYLYLQDYINSLLSYELPAFDASTLVTNAERQACIFTVHYRELSDGVATPDYTTVEETTYVLYAIKGGIEKHLHSRNNFFKYFEANKPFLTWQPSERFIDLNEATFVTFLNPNYNSELLNQSLRLAYRLTATDGNYLEGQLYFEQTGLLFHLRIALGSTIPNLFYDSQKMIYKLDIGVLADDEVTAYNYTLFFEYRPVYVYYDLMYHNSLGGVDAVRVKGDVDETIDRTTQEAAGGKDVLSMFGSSSDEEAMYVGITLQKKYKGDVGYLKTKKSQYSLAELLGAKSIYMRSAFRYAPVVALQKSQDFGMKKSSLNSFPIEWALSESNEVYTPDLNLAKGDTTMLAAPAPPPPPPPPPVCANVTQLAYDYYTNDDGTYDVWPVFQPVPGVFLYTIKFINRSLNNVMSQDVTLASDTLLSAQATEYNPVPAGDYTLQIITHCSDTSQSTGISIDFSLAEVVVTPPVTYNTDIENGLGDLIVEDIVFDGSVCTPYDNFPLQPSGSGSANIPTGIASTISVRFNQTPTGVINMAIKINGTMRETRQITTFYSQVIVSTNTYTINIGDNIEIDLF